MGYIGFVEVGEMVTNLRKIKDEERKERKKQALMDSALAVFSRKGYHDTLISDIVAEAHAGQGTFYRHFTSKRELFEALTVRFVESLISQFQDFSSNLPTTVAEYREASLRAIVRMAGLLQENREFVLLLLRDGPAIDRQFELRLEELLEEFASLARFYLDHAVRGGFARPCDSKAVAQCLVGIGRRLLDVTLRQELSAEELAKLLVEVIDFAFLGIAPRDAQTP
jgi:AcrR family transcriptional regulator